VLVVGRQAIQVRQQLLHDRLWDGTRLVSDALRKILVVNERLLWSFGPLMALHVGKHGL
jgi:hypothetical protein